MKKKDQRRPARAQQPWSKQEDQFLHCPIPAPYLAKGALSDRSAESIRWRRRQLRIVYYLSYTSSFVAISGRKAGRKKEQLKDWPDVDWDKSIEELQYETDLGQRTVWRLRKEATLATNGKPYREGRRGYSFSDFPGVNWDEKNSTKSIIKDTGLSRPVVYRLRAEWEAAKKMTNDKSRKRKASNK